MASNGTVENIAEVGKTKEVGDQVVEKPAVKDIQAAAAAGDKEESPASIVDLMGEVDEKPEEAEVEVVQVVSAKEAVDAASQEKATDGKEENGVADKKEVKEDKAAPAETKGSEEEQNPLKRKSEGIEEVPAAKIAALEVKEKEANGGAEVEAANGNA